MKNIFLILSVMTVFSSFIIGVKSIIKGNFRPQRMSWFLMVLIMILACGTLWAQGDRNAFWLALAICLTNLVIFVLSIKKGLGGTSKLDIVVLCMVIISLFIWYTTKNPLLGLIMSMITDLIALLPTLIKAWNLPETEERRIWIMGIISSFLNIISLSPIVVEKVIFPLFVLVINIIMVLIIVLRSKIKRHNLIRNTAK